MMTDADLSLHAVLGTTVNDDGLAAVRELLSGSGIDVTIETSDLRENAQGISATLSGHDPGVKGSAGARDADWIVMLHGRVNELAKRFGASGLRNTVEELRALRAEQEETSPANGLIMLVDEDTGVRLDLEFQLPVRAYEDLSSLNLRTFHADPLRFHRKTGPHGAWRGPR